MDPITHSLVGGLIAKTSGGPHWRFWILVFLSSAPDLDFLAVPLGPWAFWLQHRGITHSFFGVLMQALFYAWLFRRFDPGAYWHRAALYAVPLFLHNFCDYLTSYGVPLLSPFSFRDFSGDLAPAVTLIPALFMAWGLFRLHQQKRHGWSATRPLWAAWGLYLAFSFGSKAYASHLMKPYANGADQLAVVSGLINPFGWTAVEQWGDCCRYRSHRINVLKNAVRPGMTLETNPADPVVAITLKSERVQRYVATNRWPVARVLPASNGWNVDWGKIIFSSRGVVRGQLRVQLGSDGKVLAEYPHFTFWNPVEHRVDVVSEENKK